MAFAILQNGQPVELHPGAPFVTHSFKITDPADLGGEVQGQVGDVVALTVSHPAGALDAWSADDRARWGVLTFDLPAAPNGQVLAGYTLGLVNGAVVATGSFADPPVPAEVLRVQGRLQLLAEGKLAAVTAAVAGADAATQEYWASTAIFRRDNALLTGMWAALGHTPAELDATFRAAALIAT